MAMTSPSDKIRKTLLLLPFLLCTSGLFAQGQQPEAADTSRYAEVRSLVQFYEYMLNNVGAAKSSSRDKEVIITESYKKIFVGPHVQVEDDLINDRKVITNKDISAYMRDVDFFFQDIVFDFNDLQVEKKELAARVFYLVSFESIIEGKTLDGETYNRAESRFIEVNTNQDGDLKIASVYSTKISREKELEVWWNSLSYGWIEVFKSYMPPFDSADHLILKRIAALDSLNLSGNTTIKNLEPVAALRDLKYLDISHTDIVDLSPIRYASNLQTLKANNSALTDISTLSYFDKLKSLNLSNTKVSDIEPLKRLTFLNELRLSETYVSNFTALAEIKSLVYVDFSESRLSDAGFLASHKGLETADLSRTSLSDLYVFQLLPKLKQLNLSETAIVNLEGLEGHPSLESLDITQTKVAEISPLLSASKLQKIYADYTKVSQEEASNFMSKRPKTLVVTHSAQVMNWWSSISGDWQKAFMSIMKTQNPEKEDIIQLLNIDSLSLKGLGLKEATPLKKFQRLKHLDVSDNQFTSFNFTASMRDLSHLSGAGLPVSSTDGLDKNEKLKTLLLPHTEIVNISALSFLDELELVNLDESFVDESAVSKLLQASPKTVVIYQTETLKSWWGSLPTEWKKVFALKSSDSYHLHKLIEVDSINVTGFEISSLSPLKVFINLRYVSLNKVNVSDLKELYKHQNIQALSCTNGPLMDLDGINQLHQLETLDISNTALSNLKDLEGLRSLKDLNCSGTSISNLKGIESIYNLETLNISSTRTWRLGRLSELRNLQTLICNNTRIIDYLIDEYKVEHPEVNVIYY